jgi:hypothetical protein
LGDSSVLYFPWMSILPALGQLALASFTKFGWRTCISPVFSGLGAPTVQLAPWACRVVTWAEPTHTRDSLRWVIDLRAVSRPFFLSLFPLARKAVPNGRASSAEGGCAASGETSVQTPVRRAYRTHPRGGGELLVTRAPSWFMRKVTATASAFQSPRRKSVRVVGFLIVSSGVSALFLGSIQKG